jgi:hypothetical protein
MPYADFQPSNAGAQLNDQILKNVDFGTSLMERAQRMQISAADAEMKKSDFASNLATTALNQDNLRAELSLRKINLAETERKTSSLAKLRDEFAGVSADLDKALDFARNERDPAKQHALFARLAGDAAKYHADPELKPVLERKFSVLQASIAENEASALTIAVRENRVSIDEQAARFKFPGQALSTHMDPASGRPLWVATGKPDPSAEARALDLLSTADTPEELKAALADPSVVLMRGVSGSAVTKAYMTRRDKFAQEAVVNAANAAKFNAAGAKATAAATKAAEGRPIPATMFESTEKLRNTYSALQDIKSTYDSDKGLHGPVVGLIRDLNPWDTDAQLLAKKVTAAVPTLARGVFGEVGVLTNADMETYKSLLPNNRSNEEAAKVLFEFLSRKLETTYASRMEALQGQGYSTKGFPPLPTGAVKPPPVASGTDLQAMLREKQARQTQRTPTAPSRTP